MHNANTFSSHLGWVLASRSGSDQDCWHFCLITGQIQFRVKSVCEVSLYRVPMWPHTHTHTHTYIYIYMDINTQLWQSISYTGTQANTHVKWLVAETSEHILHSASKTVKVALTSHYSFFLLLHLPLIPSLSVVSSPFPSWWLRWNFKQELWSLSMTVTRFFFFFF